MQAELQAINHQTADRAAYLQLAETLTAFLERLRTNADTLDIGQRQRIMRLLVKEVTVGKDLITIKHSISGQTAPTGGNPQSSKSPPQHNATQIDKSYPLCKRLNSGSMSKWARAVAANSREEAPRDWIKANDVSTRKMTADPSEAIRIAIRRRSRMVRSFLSRAKLLLMNSRS
jgi:hypothetical protein